MSYEELQQEYICGLKHGLTIIRILRFEQASGDYTARQVLQDAIDRINEVIRKVEEENRRVVQESGNEGG